MGDSGSYERRRQWGIAAVLLLIVMIGFAIGRATAPDRKEPGSRVPPPDTQDSVPGPTRTVNGVPLGYARSQEGAVAAATNFARVMTGASGDPEKYRQAMRTLAAPEWRQRADELAKNTIDFVSERYGAGGIATFSPIRYHVASYSADLATVDIWGVLVALGPKVQRIDESWLIATVELSWPENDWRVVGQRSVAGPTPQLLQTDEGAPEDVLKEFREYGHAPQP